MPRSMTGYGRGEASGEKVRFTVEARSVNHRFSDIVVRLPRAYQGLEDRVRKMVQGYISRGRVDIIVSREYLPGQGQRVKVNTELARSYRESLYQLALVLECPAEVSIMDIASLPEVLALEEEEEDLEASWQVLEQALEGALGELTRMREVEGKELARDVLNRLQRIGQINEEIRAKACRVVEEYRERLALRLKEISPGLPIDENRLAMEVAILAERSSIAEEIVRLASHLAQAEKLLTSEEPVGRKLDFLAQEMFREVNTMAAKTGNLEITSLVIEAKGEIEKIREQVQNLE